MQFEMGISTMRYFPARGTAGLERSLVRGKSRVPAPPPITTARTLLVFGDIRLLWYICTFPFLRRCVGTLYLGRLNQRKRLPINALGSAGGTGREAPPRGEPNPISRQAGRRF